MYCHVVRIMHYRQDQRKKAIRAAPVRDHRLLMIAL